MAEEIGGSAASTSHPLPTIFVSIPSYRDPECQYTVLDLFAKARHPERIYIGICWQADHDEDKSCFLLDFGDHAARMRTHFLHHSDARGPCFARALIQQKLFQGEDYYLQLDSHYRMIVAWDEVLVHQLSRCPGKKPILTTYPSSYTLPDDYRPGDPDRAHSNADEHPIVMCAREFGADGFLRTGGKAVHACSFGGKPCKSLFWAAGFAFSSADVVAEVPYDISLEDLFFGEEPSMTVRLWAAGWDFFAPTCIVGYHLWTRSHRPVFREHASEAQRQRQSESEKRIRQQLSVAGFDNVASGTNAGGQCGQGPGGRDSRLSVRNLAEYETFSGINFSGQTISRKALRGGLRLTAFVYGDPAAVSEQGSLNSALPILSALPNNISATIQALAGGPAVADAPKAKLPHPRLLQPRDKAEKTVQTELLLSADADHLNRFGFVVVDGFLSKRGYAGACGSEKASQAPSIVLSAVKRIPVRAARLGGGDRIWSNTAVRGDEMAWLTIPGGCLRERAETRVRSGAKSPGDRTVDTNAGDSEHPLTEEILDDLNVLVWKLQELQRELNSVYGFGCTRTSTMLTRYPGGGARYAKHLDAPPAQASDNVGEQRRLTAVYYVNPNWEPQHGGCLRAHFPAEIGHAIRDARPSEDSPAEEPAWHLDIEPLIDRLVLFSSSSLEHEVLPSQSERYAITTWFY